MVQLTDQPIDSVNLHRNLLENTDACGAVVVFEGRVRNNHQGKAVTELVYESYGPMALKMMEDIRQQAFEKWKVDKITAVHRIGPVPLGETAVWVGAASAHRSEAFDACRYLIDEIKMRVPIWKKETYGDGSQEWVNSRC
jgi:molybdopterin synthase catalytic subunit